ncbi:MAG TPA: glutamyl-tRNA reductase [Azoarcus sp.]|nr:glutamyl-tRNA reductase [Azoarcus sp.]
MQLFALGLNHLTAPLAIRERVAFQADGLEAALYDLTHAHARPVQEAAILSTCNRTELYFSAEHPQAAADWLAGFHHLSLADVSPYLYAYPQRDAVRHVFRVAAGLDSMVLGEPQILGQVKEAVRRAEEAGTLGAVLHKLFQNTFSVAKEVRSSTAVGANVVSMAAAATRLAERIFEDLAELNVLLIGAGEMIELCAAHLGAADPARMVIANRSEERGQALAERFGAETMRLDRIGEVLAEFDVIVSCTAAPLPIVGLGMVERAVKARRHRPMVMVDLAVPRDIEPEVAKLDDVFLYTVDDLAQVVDAGLESRQQAVVEAEGIIDQRVEGFLHWLQAREMVPTIRALQGHAESLRETEFERARRLLARGESPEAVLDQLARGLTRKLMHGPMSYLNHAAGERQGEATRIVRDIFDLDRNKN